MSPEALVENIAGRLALRGPSARSPALPLVRAACELSHHQDSDVTALLHDWLRLADPSMALEAVPQIRSEWSGSDPAWLADLAVPGAGGLPPAGLILLLLRQLREDGTPSVGAFRWVDQAAAALGVSQTDDLWNWLVGAADAQVAAECAAIAVEVVSRFPALEGCLVPIAREGDFEQVRSRVLATLDDLGAALDGVQLQATRLSSLRNRLQADRFRLAVLGEFKRGKSTLINALVMEPDLMPADILPCTSALIELRPGPEREYHVNTDGPLGKYRPSDQLSFRAQAGDAARRSTSAADNPSGRAESVAQWRVILPSELLVRSNISIIDTPGLNEDLVRDLLAKREAERADAAIVVMNADQAASLEELDLIRDLKSKANDLFVLINKADAVPRRKLDDVRRHVLARIETVTTAIPPERVLLVSALRAEEALLERASSEWSEGMDAFREQLLGHLRRSAGAARILRTRKEVEEIATSLAGDLDRQVQRRRKELELLEQLDEQCQRSREEHDLAERSLANVVASLRSEGQRAAKDFASALADALPEVWLRARAFESTWTSDHRIETHPKKHIEDVAEKAKKQFMGAVQAWMRAEGAQMIEVLAERARTAAMSKGTAFEQYLKAGGGVTLDEVDSEAFASVVGTGSVVGAAMGTAVGAAAAAVIGYVVADIILFYILGIISGFLNPALLAAAAVAGMVAYALKGREWVITWVRGRVADSLGEALEKQETRSAVVTASVRAVERVFDDYANEFRRQGRAVVEEVRHHQQRSEQERREALVRFGTSGEGLHSAFAEFEGRVRRAREALELFRLAAR
jgi:GTPase Era involved in 16S rRNA processing